MKLLILTILAIAPIMSSAETIFGTDNQDVTDITVLESSMAVCEHKLNDSIDLVRAKGKLVIKISNCREVKGASAPNVFGSIRYHKYL